MIGIIFVLMGLSSVAIVARLIQRWFLARPVPNRPLYAYKKLSTQTTQKIEVARLQSETSVGSVCEQSALSEAVSKNNNKDVDGLDIKEFIKTLREKKPQELKRINEEFEDAAKDGKVLEA